MRFCVKIIKVLAATSKVKVHCIPLTTEFEVCSVSYRPSFPPLVYGSSAKHAGHKLKGKKLRIHNLQYGLRRQGWKIFIIIISTVCLTGSEMISIHVE